MHLLLFVWLSWLDNIGAPSNPDQRRNTAPVEPQKEKVHSEYLPPFCRPTLLKLGLIIGGDDESCFFLIDQDRGAGSARWWEADASDN